MKTILFISILLFCLSGIAQTDSISIIEQTTKDSIELQLIRKHKTTLQRCDSLLLLYDYESLKKCRECYESILRVDHNCWTAKIGITELERKLLALKIMQEDLLRTYVSLGDEAASTNPELAIYYYELALQIAPNSKFIEEKIRLLNHH